MLVSSNRATPGTLREILSDIRTEDIRATQIIERHRMMLKSRQVDERPIDIHSVVRDGVALIAHDARASQIQVEVDLPSGPCLVAGDHVLLKQVLVNLAMNAIEAMAETPPDRRRLTFRDEVRQDTVEVSVRDTGPGLPARVDGHLFDPFFTTKANGTGIGLTIARSIVEAHRGSLQAENNPDGGATFRVTLPLHQTRAAMVDRRGRP
jgi:signal transduction histidine kinase